jgi:hypothetical protein
VVRAPPRALPLDDREEDAVDVDVTWEALTEPGCGSGASF